MYDISCHVLIFELEVFLIKINNMRILITIIALLTINFATAQKIYKKIQGEYENPIIGDITIKGYELTYNGYTHIYQSESDNDVLDNYVYYKYPEEEGTISVRVTRNGTKYLTFSDGEYILIPKEKEKKGKVTGDPNASGYYGIGGDGSGGNYRLTNRNALNRPKPDYPCNEEGKVVVTISVDQSGNVVSAVPGAKGTTNSASCLLNEAKKAALKTKFNPDNKAPSKQVGAIIYKFSLSN